MNRARIEWLLDSVMDFGPDFGDLVGSELRVLLEDLVTFVLWVFSGQK